MISLSVYGQKECMLRKEKDSIKVYTCDNDNSRFKTIRATVLMNATLSQVTSIIMDVEKYGAWQFNTISAKMLSKPNEEDVTFYSEVDAPWPIANRDLIIRIQLSQNKQTKVVTLNCNSLPKYLPEKKPIVRVPFSKALWTLTPVSAKQVKVDYSIEINPGGAVPAWMVNMVCAQAPYESFRNFKARLASKNYNEKVAATVIDY
jgi:ribosome-associated toxin RatA of RatAB toxin-antitoxin module